jgi:hypothetical protein
MTTQMLISTALLLALLSSGPLRHSLGEGNPHQDKQAEIDTPAISKINTQITEFNQLLTDHETLENDTTNVINGLNNLGLYYSKLSMSLVRAKSLIARLSQQENWKIA